MWSAPTADTKLGRRKYSVNNQQNAGIMAWVQEEMVRIAGMSRE